MTGDEATPFATLSTVRSLVLVGLLVTAILPACGGGTPAPSSTGPSSSPATATWGTATKLADAGRVVQPPFGGPVPPAVRLEGLPDGTAFALWERMQPETASVARFAAGAWEAPVDGSGQGRLDSWLAVSLNGDAIATWGEKVPELGPGYWSGTRTWARRYVVGNGWGPPVPLQQSPGEFEIPRTIGANIGEPPLHSGVVMSDGGGAQAFWNRGYPSITFSPSDVYTARLGRAGEWSAEEPVARDNQISLLRVSRRATLALWRDPLGKRWPQAFEADRGWQDRGQSPIYVQRIALAKGGFAVTEFGPSTVIARGLGLNGDLGPPETLLPRMAPYDICGDASGALGFVYADPDAIVLKYRGALDAPPTFSTVTRQAPGQPRSPTLTCHVDASGRVLIVWTAEGATYVDRYVPGRGLEGTTVIGPGAATAPAIAEDEKGNILVAWAVLTAANSVEIWWNRLRVP